MTEAALTKFVAGNALPLVIDFNQETAQKIFSGEIKSHLLMFVSAKADEYAAQVWRINILSSYIYIPYKHLRFHWNNLTVLFMIFPHFISQSNKNFISSLKLCWTAVYTCCNYIGNLPPVNNVTIQKYIKLCFF